MVSGCINHSKKTTGVSYHRLPQDKRRKAVWFTRIPHANPCRKYSFVCSAHFLPESFVTDLAEQLCGSNNRRRLTLNAMPTIFSQSPLYVAPGHSAKHGTYTLLDENTGKIPAFSAVQVTEVTSLNAMEAEGCRRALDSVLANNVQVRCLTTDRHVTITSEMRKRYPGVKHQCDVWHLAKWIVKKLTLKAKKKKCQDLLPWIQSISNHFRWSESTCHGNYDELKKKWTSIVHHAYFQQALLG